MQESKSTDSALPGWAHIEFKDIEMGDKIGGGGVGIIYSGRFNSQTVAVKTLIDSRVGEDVKKEYMDELLVMSKMKHANVVTFLGACMTPPNWCFVMELCETSLFNVLHVNQETFSDHDKVQMAVDIGSAFEYLHSFTPAIIHRDLKSLNVLRANDGVLKVCDFGLVKNRNVTAGTPSYMAPELLQAKSYNKSVDSYAFGILFNEICNGQIPFNGVAIPDIRDRCLRGERPHQTKSIMQPQFIALIDKCWAQDPTARPDFSQIVDELMVIYDQLPATKYTTNLSGGDMLDSLMT